MTPGTSGLFIGVEITQRLQDNLDNCKKAMEVYFKEGNTEFLQVRRIGDKDFIGRALSEPFPCKDIDNVMRNVVSLLKLIVPNFRLQADQVQILTQQPPRLHRDTM